MVILNLVRCFFLVLSNAFYRYGDDFQWDGNMMFYLQKSSRSQHELHVKGCLLLPPFHIKSYVSLNLWD